MADSSTNRNVNDTKRTMTQKAQPGIGKQEQSNSVISVKCARTLY